MDTRKPELFIKYKGFTITMSGSETCDCVVIYDQDEQEYTKLLLGKGHTDMMAAVTYARDLIDAADFPDPVINTKGHGYVQHDGPEITPNDRPRHELKVTFVLDLIPGEYHQPHDMMRYIGRHPYVDTVEFIK